MNRNARAFLLPLAMMLAAPLRAQTPPHASSASGSVAGAGEATAPSVPRTLSFQDLTQGVGDELTNRCIQGEVVTQNINSRSSERSIRTMPRSYLMGMMLSYAVNQCRILSRDPGALTTLLASQPSVPSAKDSLSYYAQELGVLPSDPLTQNYALLLHLGMFESDGNPQCGVDTLTSNANEKAEAGLFQASSDSTNHGGLGKVYQELLERYTNGPDRGKCLASVFTTSQHKKSECAGTHSGACQFQQFMKDCPAAAVDYAAALLRLTYSHNGPIARKEVQPRAACLEMLGRIRRNTEALVQTGGPGACAAIQNVAPNDRDLNTLAFGASPLRRSGQNYLYNPQNGAGYFMDPAYNMRRDYRVPENERASYNEQPGAKNPIPGLDALGDALKPSSAESSNPSPPPPPEAPADSPSSGSGGASQVSPPSGPSTLSEIVPAIADYVDAQAEAQAKANERKQKDAQSKAALRDVEAAAAAALEASSARRRGRGQP